MNQLANKVVRERLRLLYGVKTWESVQDPTKWANEHRVEFDDGETFTMTGASLYGVLEEIRRRKAVKNVLAQTVVSENAANSLAYGA